MKSITDRPPDILATSLGNLAPIEDMARAEHYKQLFMPDCQIVFNPVNSIQMNLEYSLLPQLMANLQTDTCLTLSHGCSHLYLLAYVSTGIQDCC